MELWEDQRDGDIADWRGSWSWRRLGDKHRSKGRNWHSLVLTLILCYAALTLLVHVTYDDEGSHTPTRCDGGNNSSGSSRNKKRKRE